jgi:hypothetical protein
MNVIDKPALLSFSHFSNNLRRVARPGAVHVNTQLTEPVSAPPSTRGSTELQPQGTEPRGLQIAAKTFIL